MKLKTVISLLIIAFLSYGSTIKLKDPHLAPKENDENVKALISQGTKLHDEGKYEEAIKKYSEALKLNKDSPLILYEMAYSYNAIRNYKKSLEYLLKASQYKSNTIKLIYMLIGSNLDALGKPKDAISVYQKGLEIAPEYFLLHYNLGITYYGMKEKTKAMDCFKKAIRLNPNHSSSHLALAKIYLDDNYRVPAVLAYGRFLILEPKTQRTEYALMNFQRLLTSGVTLEVKDSITHVTISIPESPPQYDGDFSIVNLMMSTKVATRSTEENKDKHAIELLYDDLESIFKMMAETQKKQKYSGFVWEYYVPYFVKMEKNNLVKPFVYYICQLSDEEKIKSWISENQESLNKLIDWSNKYEF